MTIITLKAGDGHMLEAYQAGNSDAALGLVVIQEIFGINNHMRSVADDLAEQGFFVIMPALFDRIGQGIELGYAPEDVKRGRELRGQIADADTMLDVEAAAAALGARAIGIVGYCWGGTVAWWGATRSRSFKAAVGWYGGGIAATRDEEPRCPVQLHFGATDAGIPLSDVEAIRAARPEVDIHVYEGAGHGFGCSERSSYEPKAAALARERTLAFFRRHLP